MTFRQPQEPEGARWWEDPLSYSPIHGEASSLPGGIPLIPTEMQAKHREEEKRPSPERAKLEMLATWAMDLLIVGIMAVGNEYLNEFLANNAPSSMDDHEIMAIRYFCEAATIATAGLIVVYDIWKFYKELWGGKR